jgi:hypothetical protein
MLNEDYIDMLRCLHEENVKFLLVDAFAMAAHGYPRATLDIDFWVMPSPENAQAVMRALSAFGAPLHQLREEDLTRDDTIFQIGLAPRRIDIITGASGLVFEPVFNRAHTVTLGEYPVHIPCIEDLIANKLASGRDKDLVDAKNLRNLLDP